MPAGPARGCRPRPNGSMRRAGHAGDGQLRRQRRAAPGAAGGAAGVPQQMFGDGLGVDAVAYAAYPGYRPAAGAVGEYNGKFMCNQFVLRGGSCATPRGHVRASYRNFFPPRGALAVQRAAPGARRLS